MKTQDIILEIKKIEKETNKILIEANDKKEKLVSKTKLEAEELIGLSKKTFEKKKSNRLKIASKKIDDVRKKIIHDAESDIKLMEQSSLKNMDKAVDFLMNKFNKTISL